MRVLGSIVLAILALWHALASTSGPTKPTRMPLRRCVDLNIGEQRVVELSNGTKVRVKLLGLEESRDSVLNAVREAHVQVEINGRVAILNSALYHLPARVGPVRIDCPITRGPTKNSHIDHWALEKDARLRLWPADSPLLAPDTFVYPVKQRWFAATTCMANEPVSPRPHGKLYYHAGLDIGGAEGLVEVVAATDGLVVSSGEKVLAGYERTPVRPRYDVVYVLDDRGWYYRYSHLQIIAVDVLPGRRVKRGQTIGRLGKEGPSGGWAHLHFEIKSRQPSGRWGTEEAYAFLWEAYQRQYKPKLIAVARPRQHAFVGEKVVLDGSRSWSAEGRIVRYEWILSDGSRATSPRTVHTYTQPGCYSEVLKVTDAAGRVDYDSTFVIVLGRSEPDHWPPVLDAAYFPTWDIKPGDPVIFLARAFRMSAGRERWDFGDGSPPVFTRSDGCLKPHNKEGYVRLVHRFRKSGHYLVRIERTNEQGVKASAHLHVTVEKRGGTW